MRFKNRGLWMEYQNKLNRFTLFLQADRKAKNLNIRKVAQKARARVWGKNST